MRAERITDVVAYHGEGPVWWPGVGLRICDVYAGDILSIDAATGKVTARLHVGASVGAFRPRADGGVVAGIEHGFSLTNAADEVVRLPELWTDPGLRMNDGACDWLGNFYCGSLRQAEPREGAGKLFRLGNPGEPAIVVLERQGIPNGLVFDERARCAYYIDTLTKSVKRYAIEECGGSWTDGRVSVDLAGVDAWPDGMTVDADGRLWIAMWGAGTVDCFEAGSNRPVERVCVPGTTHITAATFGDDDLSTLYITTSREGPGRSPVDGSVFAVDASVTGRLQFAYRW